jgi:DNA-binding transcriptional ArsR family regulator
MSDIERRSATDAQLKAISNATRLRIMRLCHHDDWTNKALADRLGLDPSTTLHHLRILEAAGFVEARPVVQGRSGAFEKPYRSTNLSWQLILDDHLEDDESVGEPAPLAAFRHEFREAGLDSSVELTRLHLFLDDDEVAEFVRRVRAVIDEFVETNAQREQRTKPSYGVFFATHLLADPRPK